LEAIQIRGCGEVQVAPIHSSLEEPPEVDRRPDANTKLASGIVGVVLWASILFKMVDRPQRIVQEPSNLLGDSLYMCRPHSVVSLKILRSPGLRPGQERIETRRRPMASSEDQALDVIRLRYRYPPFLVQVYTLLQQLARLHTLPDLNIGSFSN